MSKGGRNRAQLCLEREGQAEGTIGVSEKGHKQLEESRKVYPSSIFHWILKQGRLEICKAEQNSSWGERRLT